MNDSVNDDAGDEKDSGTAKEAIGTVKEAVGWATGDRQVEAEGEIEQEEAAHEPVESPGQAEDRVRKEHGDVSAPTDQT